MIAPSEADAQALSAAVGTGFGPCNCRAHDDHWHLCGGHEWLISDPTRRLGVRVWQRLLFMRSQRSALQAQEGVGTPAHSPEPAPTRLPW